MTVLLCGVTLNGVREVTITATPLPSTWTMLIAGFIGLGFFAYRGSKRAILRPADSIANLSVQNQSHTPESFDGGEIVTHQRSQ